jgi:multidrug efflux system membrane fusion protein
MKPVIHAASTRASLRIRAWILLSGCVVAASAFLLQGCAGNGAPARAAKKGDRGGAVPVVVAKAVLQDVPIEVQAVGNVESYLTVTVKAQISGEITEVLFREGDFVTKGARLFTIDPRTYEGQLNQAQANLNKDQAVVAQLEANLARDQAQEKYAQAAAARHAELFERRLVAKELMEQTRANAEAVSAAVRADQAAIQSARASIEATKAAVENAKVMLSYTVIRSPLDGRTGNIDVNQGNVITPNTTLMTITQVEPIYVTFSIPEARLKEVRKSQSVTAYAQDDPSSQQTGQLTFIDNTVDPTTGMIRLKATFANKDHKLWPGQFVRATLRLGMKKDSVVVPNQAVQTGQEGPYVFVVKSDQTVESRDVTTGARIEQNIVIETGLEPGEVVVTEGQLRLAPGTKVGVGP